MADELALPILPKLSWDPTTESFANHRSRKRVRSSPPVSSDPALFSSDDDPSADNYTQERRKRKYRGPWYQQIPADAGSSEVTGPASKKGKRPFERQYDSGVFMGSDGTEMDEVMEAFEDVQFKRPRLPSRHIRPPIQLENLVTPAEELAREQIQRCLEDGDESVDLSSRGLKSLSNATIRPLSTFTCIPPVAEGVSSQIEPTLKLFLSANFLTTLPEELFKLEALNVLSLRSNAFEELPPGIGNLHNLKELSISQNHLRYLPFEILELFSVNSNLENLQIHPNPFFEPQFPAESEPVEPEEPQYKIGLGSKTRTRPRRDAVTCAPSNLDRRSWHPRWKVTYKTRTEIRYLGPDGELVQGPKFPDANTSSPGLHKSLPVAHPNDIQQAPEPRGEHHSHAPSLLEVALNACTQSPQLPHLPSLLHEECPQYLSELLIKAAAKKDSGSTKCTICNRNFIVPRTEWIEWWEIAKIVDHKTVAGMASAASPLRQKENERDVLESMVPLMRRGCSWLCVPPSISITKSDEMDLDG